MNLLRIDQDLGADSYYAETAPRERSWPSLKTREQADVAIVGGGLAGLSAAIELAERGFSVALLEAREIGWAASGRNGGQAIHGLACDMATIEAQVGMDGARLVWKATIEALDLIEQRCRQFAIDCEWQPGFIGVAVNARKARSLRQGADYLQRAYDYPMRWIEPTEVRQWVDSPAYHSAVYDARSGHLHPLKYTFGLARAAARLGVRIYENSPVRELRCDTQVHLTTAEGELSASQALLAGNVYLDGLVPALDRRVMPVGTYIVASEPMDKARLDRLIPSRSAVCDNNFVLDYFRPTIDNRLLFGGRVSYSTRTPGRLRESLRQRMVGRFPQLSDVGVTHAWGGFVDVTMNRAPDFGRLPTTPGRSAPVYYLQGFSGHGLALTGLAGRIVAEAMSGDAARFDVFARFRHLPFPGRSLLRTPALVLGMAWYRLRDILG
jgi:gamma-glutamylputrescine oxidase